VSVVTSVVTGIATTERAAWRWVAASALTFCAAAVLLPFLGPSPLDLARVWSRQEPDWSIFVQLRLSRTLLGLFSGAALALGGSVFQAMLRDALATPDMLGVSAGASLGAVAAIALGWHLVAGVSGSGSARSPAPRPCSSWSSRRRPSSATSRPTACCSPALRPTASAGR